MKVLLLTDFSKDAQNAALFAINAISSESEFILANSYEFDDASDYTADTNEYKSKENLKKEVERLKSLKKDLNISTVSSPGEPEDLAKRFEERGNADLIIMGTKGRGYDKTYAPMYNLEDMRVNTEDSSSEKNELMGKVALKVSKETVMPVLCVPSNAKFTGIDRIALAIESDDFNLEENLFDPLLIIAKNFDATVEILTIVNKDEKSKIDHNATKIQAELFKGVKSNWNLITDDKDSDTIESFCKDNEIKILTVISKNKNFFRKIFQPSMTEQLIKNANLPLLVLDADN